MTDKEVMLIVLNELIGIRKNCSSLLNRIEDQRETLETALTQPNKEWVGLTDDEKHGAVWSGGEFGDGMLWAEKLLKERNT